MEWLTYLSYFFGGLFLGNTIPHLVSGMSGRPFQSPFAKPPGKGLSSSTVNVLWGNLNLAISYGLIFHVGSFDVHNGRQVLAVGVGFLLISIVCARTFGKFHGGNAPTG